MLCMTYSPFLQTLTTRKRKRNASFAVKRRRKEAMSVSTGQWLGLMFIIAVVVGAIFVSTIYYFYRK